MSCLNVSKASSSSSLLFYSCSISSRPTCTSLRTGVAAPQLTCAETCTFHFILMWVRRDSQFSLSNTVCSASDWHVQPVLPLSPLITLSWQKYRRICGINITVSIYKLHASSKYTTISSIIWQYMLYVIWDVIQTATRGTSKSLSSYYINSIYL